MRLPSPSGGWWPFLWRVVPLMVLLLVPWPGLPAAFSSAMAGACEAIASVVPAEDAEIRFTPESYVPEHPWWVRMSVKNVFTNETFQLPVDTRTVGYIRIVVFLALALAWPFWAARRGVEAASAGFAVLVALIALTVVCPLLQVLAMVKVFALGTLTKSMLSIVTHSLVTYPSMAFAVPGFVWLLTLRLTAGSPKPSAKPTRATAERQEAAESR